MEFLLKLLSGIIDSFKTRNAKVFAVIAAVLTALYWGIESFTTQLIPDIAAVVGSTDAAYALLTTVKGVIVTGLTLLGAHTPKPPAGTRTPVNSGINRVVPALFICLLLTFSCRANYSYCTPVKATKITERTAKKLGLTDVEAYRYRGWIFCVFADGNTEIVPRSRVKN